MIEEPASASAVRIAQPEDIEGVMALARLMHSEVGILPLDEAKTRAELAGAIGRGLVGVTGYPLPRACLCMTINAPYYSQSKMLVEFMFFVHPDHRKTSYARSLIAWAKFVSDGIGLPLLLGVFGVKRTAAKVRLCERQLEHVGATFMHNRHLTEARIADRAEMP